MDISYVVKIKVCKSVYPDYKRWLQNHVKGNAAHGIRGMMEIQHQGKFLFPSVEIFTTNVIGDFHLLTVNFYTDHVDNVDNYIRHYADIMRKQMPPEYHERTSFNRFIGTGRSVRPLGQVDEELESLFNEHSASSYNLASFEVYR